VRGTPLLALDLRPNFGRDRHFGGDTLHEPAAISLTFFSPIADKREKAKWLQTYNKQGFAVKKKEICSQREA